MVVVARALLLLVAVMGCVDRSDDPAQGGRDGGPDGEPDGEPDREPDGEPDPRACGAWQVEEVDIGVGAPTLVLDPTGAPHLAYRRCSAPEDPESCALVHSVRSEGGWLSAIAGTGSHDLQVAFDPAGTPLLAYRSY